MKKYEIYLRWAISLCLLLGVSGYQVRHLRAAQADLPIETASSVQAEPPAAASATSEAPASEPA